MLIFLLEHNNHFEEEMKEQGLKYWPLPEYDLDGSLYRGESLFDKNSISLSECEELLDLCTLARKASHAAALRFTTLAKARGLEPHDVRDACELVAFSVPDWENGLGFLTDSGLIQWQPDAAAHESRDDIASPAGGRG